MTSNNGQSIGADRIRRRTFLTASVLAVTGLAGCSSGDETGTPVSSRTLPETPESGGGTSKADTPEAATRSFYSTLYAQNDIEAANGMYHSDSPFEGLEPGDFERFGGLSEVQTEIESVEVVSQGDGRARVHAEVIYTTESGTMDRALTDYVFLRQEGEEWRIMNWAPERIRRIQAKGTVEEFYAALFDATDLEAANAMYHPDSEGGPLTAADFEPFGGLENIETEIDSMRVVSEGGGAAEVHAEVLYTTPSGAMDSTLTDHVFLKRHQGSWQIDRWLPQRVREAMEEDSEN